MSFRLIEDHRHAYPVRVLCAVLEVSPAGYYDWRARSPSARSSVNAELVAAIRRVHHDSGGRYGSPRVHAALRTQGRGTSRGRIERLMRRHGIRAIMAPPRRAHNGQPPRAADRAECPRSRLHRRSAEPRLARRHHIHPDR